MAKRAKTGFALSQEVKQEHGKPSKRLLCDKKTVILGK